MSKANPTEVIIEVMQTGPSASLQDLGRKQSTHHGVTEGGAADIHAAMWANYLLRRDISEALIEIAVGLFAVEFAVDCQIAVTGADLGAILNGQKLAIWQSHKIAKGDQLKFTMPITGLRSYLAINAELQLDRVFSSAATVVRENLGGLDGSDLRKGDKLCGTIKESDPVNRHVPQQFIPDYSAPLELQLLPSYQFAQFSQQAIDTLLASKYQIQNNSNRMAYALRGDKIEHSINALTSEGIAYGAVQIPPDGQPIILLNDRQTMGGYPKVGCISRLSGAALAQRIFPSEVRFSESSFDTAASQYNKFLEFFKQNNH